MWTGTVTEVVKKHIWCIIMGLVIILIGILTVRFGSSDEAVNLLSFAGAVASIILALVAILYGAMASWRAEQSVGEMQRMIGRGQRKLEKKMESFGDIAQRIEGLGAILGSAPPGPEKPEERTESLQGNYSLDLNGSAGFPLVVFYGIAMSHKSSRLWNAWELAGIYFPGVTETERLMWSSHLMGCLCAFECFLESDSFLEVHGQGDFAAFTFMIKKLPNGFLEYTQEALERRISHKETSAEQRENLVALKKRIDEYFIAQPAKSK